MKWKIRAMAASALMMALVLTAGCVSVEKSKFADVYVSYETREDALSPAVTFGPKKVRRLVIEPDKAILYYEDNRGEFVPLDTKKMKWFKWSVTPE